MDAERQGRICDYWQTARPDSFGGAHARLRHLARRAGRTRVLNVGIGDGAFEEASLALGADVHALDPSAGAVDALRARLNLGERAQAGSAVQIPWPDGYFDAVVASEVLEHLDDATLLAARDEFARVLRPGGRLLGTVPAREQLSANTVVCPYCTRAFHRWGHERAFDPAALRDLLSPRFAAVAVEERVFVTWNRLNWKGRLTAVARVALVAVGGHSAAANLLFTAERA